MQTYKGSCHCGRVTFEMEAKLDSTRWAVNVRCIDGVDLSGLPVRLFDGEHWEDAAKAFRGEPRK